ncbi:MAG: 50S ribosomal protein L1 [Alphaproteobacteria bacterium]|nr:50S ribosomal protein L1 [Alphaproteobacteria bacterium]
MGHVGKRIKAARTGIDRVKLYGLDEALKLVRERANAKFDETVEIAMNLGVDPKHADQMVRGVVNLPNGTGRVLRVAVFARGAKADEAKAAGADIVGADELVNIVLGGTIDFDPMDVKSAVVASKGGAVEFRVEKAGIIQGSVGKVSFSADKLAENIKAFVDAVAKAKPQGSKGTYIQRVALSSTMGPGVKVDPATVMTAPQMGS